MGYIVKCPQCNEVNVGSLLHCNKCQTSLIGIPREQGESPISEFVSPPRENYHIKPLQFKPENLGEKWVLHIVKSMSEDNRWNTIYKLPWFIAFVVIMGAVLIVSISEKDFFTTAVATAYLFLLLSLFERWHFTRIIKRQQEQIYSLDKELNTIKLSK